MRRALALLFAVLALAGLLLLAANETFVWVDERGVTHLSNDPEAVPHEGRGSDFAADLDSLWEGPLSDAPPVAAAADRDEARTRRLLEGAVEDLRRGENARAAVALESILRERPTRPEPHWYLALLDRHRGRYDSSEAHLRAFLAASGDGLEAWRASALRRLGELEDERRVSDAGRESDPGQWASRDGMHFRLAVDPALASASPAFADTVLRYLDEARETLEQRLDARPAEPMGVVLYGRGAYDRAYSERFSFRTVGFFDGRMHVVSAAHPAGELRALLFHEYVHAVFRERTGGDRPYWLNEGLAELAERLSRSQPRLTRSERSLLNRRLSAGDWLPLQRLAPGFSGLDDEGARAAYLEAAAAAAWIEDHTDRAARGRLLAQIGKGRSDDEALRAVLGLDTNAVDAAVRQEIASEFASGGARSDAKPGDRS
jgi:tetratricopeptide (TPR) repeat protein